MTDEDELCNMCAGSGEGQVDGSRCYRCHGRGLVPTVEEEEDEPDYYSQEKDRRLEEQWEKEKK